MSRLIEGRLRVLREDRFNGRAEVDFKPFVAGNFQTAVVQSQLVQQGGVKVCDVVSIFHCVEADFIGGLGRELDLQPPALLAEV